MRRSGSWMSIWDDRILEYIFEGDAGSPTKIAEADNIHVSKQHVSRRLRELAEHDLLKPVGNGVHLITERGECYLAGKYDAEKGEYIPEANTQASSLGVAATDNEV